MRLKFVLGEANSGKTSALMGRAAALAREEPLGPPVLVLVPEQASYMTEQLLLGELEGMVRIRVVSFQRLIQWVYSLGAPPELRPMDEEHRRVLSTMAIQELRKAGSAGRLLQTRGIEATLSQFVAEFRHQGLGVSDLEDLLNDSRDSFPLLHDKIGELRLFLEMFSRLSAGRFEDPAGSLASVVEAIGSLGVFQGMSLFVDGFHGFSPPEMQILIALARRAARSEIALSLDGRSYRRVLETMTPSPGSRMFPVEEALVQLLRMATGDGEEVALESEVLSGDGGHTSAAIETLSVEFLRPRPRVFEGGLEGVRLLECRDREDEARAAVEQLLRWRREELMTELHHAFKRAHGYSDLEIAQKRSALERIMIPETLVQHRDRLAMAGFEMVSVWFQCLNFASIIAIKSMS